MSRRVRVRLAAIAVVLGLVLAAGGGNVSGSTSAQGSVLVDSDITTDTTWAAGSGPYRVVKSVDVSQGAKLTIEHGVVVEVAEGVNLTVEGNIDVAGTPDDPVVFTSSKSDPTPGSWGSLVISGPTYQTTVIRHATFEYATDAITVDGSQIVRLEKVDISRSSEAGIRGVRSSGFAPAGEITITDSAIHDNGFGIEGADEKYVLGDSTVTNNARSGIKLANHLNVVDLSIEGTEIAHNDVGINLESRVDQHNRGGLVSNIHIADSQITENAGVGVRLFGDRITNVAIEGVEIAGNGGSGLHLQDTGWKGGSRASRNVTIADATFRNNGDRGAVIDAAYSNLEAVSITDSAFANNGAAGLLVDADRALGDVTVTAVTATMNGGTGIDIGGTDLADLALTDAHVFGNHQDGVAIDAVNVSGVAVSGSTVAFNDQTGLAVNGSGPDIQTTITGTTVAGNGDGVFVANHAARITDSTIEQNSGIGLEFNGTAPVPNLVSETDLYGNGVALQVPPSATELVADANGNYWGAESGPFHPSINPEGEGNRVNGSLETVQFLEYATSPFGEVNQRPTASLSVPTEPVQNSTDVSIAAGGSSDDGSVTWYRFQINDSTDTGWIQQSTITHSFETKGTYRVNVTVVDDDGVPSTNDAVATIAVTTGNQDSTGGEQTTDGGKSGKNGGNGKTTTIDAGVTVPGFGVIAALFALLGAALVARRVV